MVVIIAGTAKSGRNTVGRLLAESLGWEFVDAENFRAQGNIDAGRQIASRAHADRTWRVETLSTAINLWIYEWRDVAVSCPVLTEEEQRQLSRMSSLVKIVCLDEFRTANRNRFSDRSVGVAISQSPPGFNASRDPEQNVVTPDLFRPVEEIIAKLTAVLMR